MSYRTKTTIIAIVCVVLAAVVCGVAVKYANDEEFKNWTDSFTTTDADGDSYWDNLMPWDSNDASDITAEPSNTTVKPNTTTAKPNTTTTPSGGNDNIVTGEFVSGRNLTLYGSYLEYDDGRDYYGFSANGLKGNTNYRVRITFPCGDPFGCSVMYYQGAEGWHEYVTYKSPGVKGFGIYDSDTREVSADFVIRTGSDGSVRFMLFSPEVVYTGEDKHQKMQAYADSRLSGYSVSLTQTDAGISECLCCSEAVG